MKRWKITGKLGFCNFAISCNAWLLGTNHWVAQVFVDGIWRSNAILLSEILEAKVFKVKFYRDGIFLISSSYPGDLVPFDF